jgi:hypothetical protein
MDGVTFLLVLFGALLAAAAAIASLGAGRRHDLRRIGSAPKVNACDSLGPDGASRGSLAATQTAH